MIEHPATDGKPALDEESFTRLLAAAYVMQEHRDRVRAKVSPADLTQIISQVVETQYEIHSRPLAAAAAFDLIAKRLCALSGAAGVVIAAKNGDQLRYQACAGTAATQLRSELSKTATLAAPCLKTGAAFQSPLAQTDPRLDAAQCRRLGARSLLAVPLYHDGKTAGAIEMYFPEVSGFGETEARAAELMAGIASEVLADIAEQEIKEELESERASVLQALEMLEPELQKIGQPVEQRGAIASVKSETELCRACGHAFVGNETYCGVCGASRASGMYPGAVLQSKWAVLWERHLTGAEQNGMPLFRKPPHDDAVSSIGKLPADSTVERQISEEPWEEQIPDSTTFDNPAPQEEAGTAIELSPWNSAADAQERLEAHHPDTAWKARLRPLRSRPGDTSLALAVLILLITLVWALLPRKDNTSLASARPPGIATIKRKPRPKPPKLTLFEQVLVGLGLAVPPPAPQYMGDPNIKVWEDLQTALYYCPDADLYGATTKGRYTSQAEAQLDAFEPAFRKPCD